MPLFCALFGIVLTYAAKKKGEKRMKKIIELRNISKSFGDETVLDCISLDIHDNEFITLLGPSGCGKTTTLRIIGGFEFPDEGDVIFMGYRHYGMDEEEPGVYYWHKGVEVDFYVPSEQMAVQASYSIADDETRKREVGALEALAKAMLLKRAIIVTYDEEETIMTPSGLTVPV